MAVAELKWRSLTAAINERKNPNTFVRRRFFGDVVTLPTETIEVSYFDRDRIAAPFVEVNGEAKVVQGSAERFYAVTAPHIRIKRPMGAHDLLFKRRPGNAIFLGGADEAVRQMRGHINREQENLDNDILNTEELMCCQMLDQGVISYSVDGDASFTITIPRPAANNVTLTTFWDDATPADVDIKDDVIAIKKIAADAVGAGLTDCILGAEAAAAFRDVMEAKNLLGDLQNVLVGSLDLTTQYQDSGVLYMGRMFGINWWEYSRTVSVNGVATDLIRSKYAVFVPSGNVPQNTMYYGAIPDMKALQGRLFQGRRFSKSWEQDDPSVRWILMASRPLPITRRPGAVVTVKVVSG